MSFRFSSLSRFVAKFANTTVVLTIGLLGVSASSAHAQSTASLQLLMGNPSGATSNVLNTANYLMMKPQFAQSYNKTHATPNWVSWHLGPADLGSASRSDNFHGDTTLPAGWFQVQDSDYSGSGYDRGHNCPSADRTATDADNLATFVMSNIVPQTADNNQGPWAKFEDYCRSLAQAGNNLFIVSTGNTYSTKTVDGGKIYVPGYMSKVVLVLPKGTSLSPASVTTSTRVICVDMPNVAGIRSNTWQSYRISVDKLEQYTGYNFFSNVPASIQAVIEAKVDNG